MSKTDIDFLVKEFICSAKLTCSLPFGWNQPPFTFLMAVFLITLVAGIPSLLGLKTNFSLVIFTIGNIFLRSYRLSFGSIYHGDAMIVMALAVLSLSPAGEVLSIDNLQERLRQSIRQRKFEFFNILSDRSLYASWPLLLIQWMLAITYFDSAISKLTKGSGLISLDWLNGYTLQSILLRPSTSDGFNAANWLGSHHTLAVISSWIAILFEGTFFLVLIFPKLARIYLPMGVAFHTGIFLTMNLNFFMLVATYAVFIPWASIIKNMSRRQQFSHPEKKPAIFYDGLCPQCRRLMTILCYFDWFNRLTYKDLEEQEQCHTLAESHPEILLEDHQRKVYLLLPNGSMRRGFFAFRKILWYLPPLYPLLIVCYFPGASTIAKISSRSKLEF